MQRKKSSIPSDVETGLVNLRSTICNLSVLPVEILQQQMVPKVQTDQADSEVTMATSNIPVEESDKNVPVIHINEGGHPQVLNTGPSVIVLNVDDHNNIQSMNVEETAPYFSTMESLLKTPVKSRHTAVKSKKRGRLTMSSIIGENLMDEEALPAHSEQHITITPLKDKPVQITPKQRGKDSNKKMMTPKRRVKQVVINISLFHIRCHIWNEYMSTTFSEYCSCFSELQHLINHRFTDSITVKKN